MIIENDIGYVQRRLDFTQANIESLAVKYRRLSDEIDCLQKDERELFGELFKLGELPDWDKVVTWGRVLEGVETWFDFIRNGRDKSRYTADKYEVVIVADNVIYGCNDIICMPDSEVICLGELL